MTEKMLKDALQEVKLSDDKKRQILKKVKMQKGQKVSYGRRKKLAIATVGFACVICVGFFYSLDHLTMENPSGEKEGLQMSTTGENTSTNDLEEENEENGRRPHERVSRPGRAQPAARCAYPGEAA